MHPGSNRRGGASWAAGGTAFFGFYLSEGQFPFLSLSLANRTLAKYARAYPWQGATQTQAVRQLLNVW